MDAFANNHSSQVLYLLLVNQHAQWTITETFENNRYCGEKDAARRHLSDDALATVYRLSETS
jgi:hypothetical protein